MHCSNYYYNEPAIQVCKMICENSCFDKVFFANSGAEANEGQIKLARKYAKDHGHPERYVVISMLKSFHGRTLATATATGQEIVHNPKWFSPLPELPLCRVQQPGIREGPDGRRRVRHSH